MTRSIAVVAVLLAATVTSNAHAHDPWESNALALNPNAPNDMVLRTNRGVAFTHDGGETWHFVCRVVINPTTLTPGVTTQGTALLGTFNGMEIVDTDGCNQQTYDTPMSGLWVADLQLDPTDSNAWYATTARGGAPNGVFRSTNNGQTWSVVGDLETGPFFKQLRITPDGQRMYLGMAEYIEPTATSEGHVNYSVRYSDDRGESWTSFPFEIEPNEMEMVLLDVDPENHDRVFIATHACRQDNGCYDPADGPPMDRILVSEDRGETWSLLFEVEEVAAFEINDRYIWVGDWWQGFWRLDRDGQNPVELDSLLKPGCIHARGDELLVCGTDLYGFMLARSMDDGTTLQPLVSSESILGNPVCEPSDVDAGISVENACRDNWSDLCRESFFDDPNPPAECTGFIHLDAGIDAGTPEPRGGGCDCGVVGPSGASPDGSQGLFALIGLAAIVGQRVQRRKRFQVRPTR